MATLGIDIGGTSVKACLLEGDACHVARSSVYANPSREELIGAIREAIGQLGKIPDASMPVGLCLPGKRADDGCSIERAVNLPCLDGWRFDELMIQALGYRAGTWRVLSDVQAAGEDFVGAHKCCDRSAIIAIGTGVGLAVFDGSEAAGIGKRGIGHLGMIDMGRLGEHDVVGPDGSKNTLESYIGARAIEARFPGVEPAQLPEAIGRLAMDEPTMIAIVRMIRVVHAIYVPDRIVLIGGVGMALKPLQNKLQTTINDGLTSLANPNWELMFGDSPYHAARGVARSVC